MILALMLAIDNTLLSTWEELMAVKLMVELSMLEFSILESKACVPITVLFVTLVNSIRERFMSDSRISLLLTVEFSMMLPNISPGFMVKGERIPMMLPFNTLE